MRWKGTRYTKLLQARSDTRKTGKKKAKTAKRRKRKVGGRRLN